MKDQDMISCQDAVERVYEYLDGELDPSWNEQVREHIEVCKKCYPYFNFERIFLDYVRSRGTRDEDSGELEGKVLTLVRQEG